MELTKVDAIHYACKVLENKINELLSHKDFIIIGLVGGHTIQDYLINFRNLEVDFEKIHFFQLDERIVPDYSDERNLNMLNKLFFDPLLSMGKIARHQIHAFDVRDDVDSAVRAYSMQLTKLQDYIDICILTAGPDGHIASLFPDHESIRNGSHYFIEVKNSPKLPRIRMSASCNLIKRSKMALLLFSNRELVYENYLNEKIDYINYPCKIILEVPKHFELLEKK